MDWGSSAPTRMWMAVEVVPDTPTGLSLTYCASHRSARSRSTTRTNQITCILPHLTFQVSPQCNSLYTRMSPQDGKYFLVQLQLLIVIGSAGVTQISQVKFGDIDRQSGRSKPVEIALHNVVSAPSSSKRCPCTPMPSISPLSFNKLMT